MSCKASIVGYVRFEGKRHKNVCIQDMHKCANAYSDQIGLFEILNDKVRMQGMTWLRFPDRAGFPLASSHSSKGTLTFGHGQSTAAGNCPFVSVHGKRGDVPWHNITDALVSGCLRPLKSVMLAPRPASHLPPWRRLEKLPLPNGTCTPIQVPIPVQDVYNDFGGDWAMINCKDDADKLQSKQFNRELIDICNHYLSQGPSTRGLSFLDVGAGSGDTAVPVARCLAAITGQVVALETSPFQLELLRLNIEANAVENAKLLFFHAATGAADRARNKNCANGMVRIASIFRAGRMYRVFFMCVRPRGLEGNHLRNAEQFLRQAPPCYIKMDADRKLLQKMGTPLESVESYLASMPYDLYAQLRSSYIFRQRDLSQSLEGKL
jgi:FkbM family methyltransferase